MFKKNDMGQKDNQGTIIASGVRVEGDFASQGNVLVEGEVLGSMKTETDLAVGERARISADVSALNAVISGEVRGNVRVSERLDLTKTARIAGDVTAKVLSIEAGAILNGKCCVGEEVKPVSVKAAVHAVARHNNIVSDAS